MPRPRSQNPGHSNGRGRALRRLAGHPALDFANTIDADRPQPDTLKNYRDVIAWCDSAGLLGPGEAGRLKQEARAAPASAERQHREVLALRDLATRLYSARVRGRAARPKDVAALNLLLRTYGRSAELQVVELGYARRFGSNAAKLVDPLRQLLGLVSAFLTSSDFARVGRCAGEGCGWFFIDRTPTRRRRWCSMEGCGNRAKAQLHYLRHRAVKSAAVGN